MRKSLFLTLVVSLCVADFGANAAVAQRGNARGGNTQQASATNTNTQQSVVSARAATRRQVTNNIAPSTGNTAARAATKQTKANVVSARAGSTQKVINTGTKVATATENTMVPQECQDAFYGCMDAFCMLDNASGGRCQCNDKITELDAVLEDILKLDEQSYIMATEGVERIQMGEAESEIMARAKAAGEKAASGNSAEENRKKARILDLSVFDNNIFSELDDDIFESQDTQNALLNKKGTALFNETTKLCGAQIPAQCKTYGSMLQLVYAQKIKSDCIAYENSLKAQKNQSQQKLQTAQKALRDAALDEYKNQNKYATVGECVIAFTDCVKTTGECGDDYTGCVTFAAQENLKNDKKGTKAKQTKIKGSKGGADITLAASTMEQLMAKKLICERVTKQCVNANKNDAVWNAFLRNAAPALKSAELIAEQNLRSNCIPTVAKCFTDACKSKFGENDESYDMCLSNPETYKSLCKVQLEPCLEATGGDYTNPTKSSLWNGLLAMLGAMKVDTCTKEVKDCLLSEDRCGKDYAGCIGLDTKTIGDLCPYEKLTACMSKEYPGYNTAEDGVRAYVAQVAQGLALQIENSMATICQNAAQEAMIKACGDTESCDAALLDLSRLESNMKIEICEGTTCVSSLSDIKTVINGELNTDNLRGYHAVLQNAPNISVVRFSQATTSTPTTETSKSITFDADNQTDLKDILDNALTRIMNQINSDPKVTYCREGRRVTGFNANDFIGSGNKVARFPDLTYSYESVIASSLMSKLSEENAKLTSKFAQQMADIDNQITETIYAGDEQKVDKINEINCLHKYNVPAALRCHQVTYDEQGNKNERTLDDDEGEDCDDSQIAASGIQELTDKVATYDAESNVCSVQTIHYTCTDWRIIWFGDNYCAAFDNGTVTNTQNIQMAKSR